MLPRSLLAAAVLALFITVGGGQLASAHPERAELAPRATLATFAGMWVGHTRQLFITRAGRAREHIDDGCCIPVMDVYFRLSRPRGTSRAATATATATAVRVLEKGVRAPHVGEIGTLRLRTGVITESLTGTTYCNGHPRPGWACGA
jgi:hypothetical protein